MLSAHICGAANTMTVLNGRPAGSIIYDTPGTYSFVVPAGVYYLSAVCVGAGGGGSVGTTSVLPTGGGAGGGLRYITDLPVTPGETITVEVGAGGIIHAASQNYHIGTITATFTTSSYNIAWDGTTVSWASRAPQVGDTFGGAGFYGFTAATVITNITSSIITVSTLATSAGTSVAAPYGVAQGTGWGTRSGLFRGSNTLVYAAGGGAGTYDFTPSDLGGAGSTIGVGPYGGTIGGGNGGGSGTINTARSVGGGGAGGYSAAGGSAMNSTTGVASTGGGGGGGAYTTTSGATAGGGGGVGLFGPGTNGAAGGMQGSNGTSRSVLINATYGTPGGLNTTTPRGAGGFPGGGGAGGYGLRTAYTSDECKGGNGAVRIIWGFGRNFTKAQYAW